MKKISIIENGHLQVSELNEIIEILKQTEEKIIDLQNYSSKDFSFLNQKFLTFHKKTKALIEKINGYKNNIWGNSTKNNLEIYINKVGGFSDIVSKIKQTFLNQIEYFKELHEKIGYIHVPLSNYKQNLFTLKLLSTNLKIDKLATLKRERISDKIDDLILILESISLFFPKINKYIEEYLSELDVVISELIMCMDSCQLVDNDFSQFLNFSKLINEKISDSKKINEEFEKYEKFSNKNVDTIITKLQYQDIIRQRIEHIQETHKEMISDLTELTNLNQKKDDYQKIFFQIKDIVGLQSAHLIQINQEFQKAIEKISETLKDYNSNISTLSKIAGSQINIFSDPSLKFNIGLSTSSSTRKYSEIENLLSVLTKKINDLNNKTNELSGYFEDIKGISERMEKVSRSINQNSNTSTLSKISSLLNDNLKLSEKINGDIEGFLLIFNAEKDNHFNDIYKEVILLREVSGKIEIPEIKLIIDNLYDLSLEIESHLKEYNYEQKLISSALHELQYYQYFEKNVNYIIEYLNTINESFSSVLETTDRNIEKNIDYIKERYTTSTEHIVHKEYSGSEENQTNEVFINNNDIDDEENIDNVEFF